jgi:hypothetical protein
MSLYISSAKQQASLGWDCQNHAGSVQRFVGESRRYLSKPCGGHHITCRLIDWLSSFATFRFVPYPGLQIALFVIGAAGMHALFSFFSFTDAFLGFGRSVSWKEDSDDKIIPPGHTMTYKDALHVTTTDFVLKLTVPGWALSLTPRLRKVKLGFEELHVRQWNYYYYYWLRW